MVPGLGKTLANNESCCQTKRWQGESTSSNFRQLLFKLRSGLANTSNSLEPLSAQIPAGSNDHSYRRSLARFLLP